MTILSNDTKPAQEGLRPTRTQCLREAAKVYADHLARVAALGGRETAAA
ncbi:hypothetical protein DFO58_3268 [Arthrobacter sp. AG1021]|nr:hypothetical protein [Arthrobacter sp. AG1021]RKS16711.1 hypothetical protein DFO58_3268 [Arthrobacter sp. AG1021]